MSTLWFTVVDFPQFTLLISGGASIVLYIKHKPNSKA